MDAVLPVLAPKPAADWLLRQLGVAPGRWLDARGPRLVTDSRQLRAGDAFVAWPGYVRDGRAFVADALADGAVACVVEADGLEDWADAGWDVRRVVAVRGLKAATGPMAAQCHGEPSRALRVIASTGTNGKTSTTWWMAQALTQVGRRCGVIGTLGVGTPPTARDPQARIEATGFTTPDPVTVQRTLRALVDDGLSCCAVEATSIGLAEHRLDAVSIDTVLYTNFTPDHLDYHGTMEAYWAAKRALFDWPGLRAVVLNLDDAHGAALAAELVAAGRLEVWTYSARGAVALAGARHLQARAVRHAARGLAFDLVEDGQETVAIDSGLVGDYNVANLLAVLGALRAQGLAPAEAAALVPDLSSVPGRMQRVNEGHGEPLVVVDYAHTPDALDQALQAVRPLAVARGGRLVCVFGCGGNRDRAKRPVMGGLAAARADQVVVTSDNPRLEDPAAIVAEILAGCGGAAHVRAEIDRRRAIEQALRAAGAADVVLIAGKGHEDYQDIGGHKTHFSDIEEAQRWLTAAVPQGAGR